ncbi:MAG: hypothetical protein EAZ57_00030 [Cytophagales bacterium]|nr:MAG: hypothetical protein EAZ67_12965 [Cytophagales bacterium]TAF62564.1 MAG: hypothetical protein EAZ57_00030 [Cytophagales bacterium]
MTSISVYPKLNFEEISAEAIAQTSSQALEIAREKLNDFCANSSSEWLLEELVEQYDTLFLPLSHVYGSIYLLANTHQSEQVRQAAYTAMPQIAAFYSQLSTNEALFERFKAIQKDSKAHAPAPYLKYWTESIEGFEKNGLMLSKEMRESLQDLKNELTQLGMDFQKNINADNTLVDFSKEELEGLPNDFLEKYQQEDGSFKLPLLENSYRPVMEYANSVETRHKMYLAYLNRAAQTNPPLLDKIIQKRQALAQMLGFKTYSDYVLSDRMAKNAQSAQQFEARVYEKIKLKAALDYIKLLFVKYGQNLTSLFTRPNELCATQVLEEQSFLQFEQRLVDCLQSIALLEPLAACSAQALSKPLEISGEDSNRLFDFCRLIARSPNGLRAWEMSFLNRILLERVYALDKEKIKVYFPLQAVLEGVFSIAGKLFDLNFKASPQTSTWHESVTAYEVYHKQNLLGFLYLDLYPRPNKFTHFACFGFNAGKQATAERVQPHVALVCNFDAPTDAQPSLLTHNHVETVFHEFGHALHNLVSRAALTGQFGTSVARDFVEVPSQWFEMWAWDYESLSLFAKHYQTGEVLPKSLFESMIAAKNVGSGLGCLQQVLYGQYDLLLHNGFEPSFEGHSVAVWSEIQEKYGITASVPGTCFGAGFGHLIGYGSGYYGYLWALVYAIDCQSVFKQKGIFDVHTSHRWLENVLSLGGSLAEKDQIVSFLGREPDENAFLESIWP